MSEPRVEVFATLESLSAAAAEEIAHALSEAAAGGRATIALAGGSTPRIMYRHLAEHHRKLPWEHVHVFWSDERYVPHNAPESNYRMARETLLDYVPVVADNVHPMPTVAPSPEDAARTYEELLLREFGRLPCFDIIVLGVGADGHTASLFPGSPALDEGERWVVPAQAPSRPQQRLTLTVPVINASRAVHFLVSGASKYEALHCALQGGDCPAALVQPTAGTLTWWVDEAAMYGGDIDTW